MKCKFPCQKNVISPKLTSDFYYHVRLTSGLSSEGPILTSDR